MAQPPSPTLEARRQQAFPTLAPDEIERMRRFGRPVRYRDGERVYETGKRTAGMLVVLSGAIRITSRDAHGQDIAVVDHVAGSFSGELGLLSGRPSFVDAVAVGDVEALLIESEKIHGLLVAEASLGEKVMRAMILRRVALLEAGTGGPVLVGPASSKDVARLSNFLNRNGMPHQVLDPADDADARAFIERYAPSANELPLAVCPNGAVLRNPTERELATCIGMLDSTASAGHVYDVAIAGAGPAGLSTAVYAASEGLSVIVIDARSFGGQAGASARIENYLGFPTGISGQALAGRAYTQAQKFGAEMLIPSEVAGLDCKRASDRDPIALRLADGQKVRSKTVVIATGARYKRPDYPGLSAMEGQGIWYWASPIEAKICSGQEVALVGGGNSAGQAAVFLSAHAARVWMLVRGPGLAASMSKYLIDRIDAIANIELLTNTEIVSLNGQTTRGIESVTWRNRETKAEATRPIRNVFLFLGADPTTEWLKGCDVAVDPKGFVSTGNERGNSLETNVPGVFAVGDVRAGSTKRVGAAIGEGAAAVSQIHAFLAQATTTA